MDDMFRMTLRRPQRQVAVQMMEYYPVMHCMSPRLVRPFRSTIAVSSSCRNVSCPDPSRPHRDHHRRADDVRVHSRRPEGIEIEFLR